MKGIIRLAQAVQPLVDKTGTNWKVTSWYRDSASNAAAGSSPQSRHLIGDAMDFYYDEAGTEAALFNSIKDTWDGGLAMNSGSFVHIDTGARRRWGY